MCQKKNPTKPKQRLILSSILSEGANPRLAATASIDPVCDQAGNVSLAEEDVLILGGTTYFHTGIHN